MDEELLNVFTPREISEIWGINFNTVRKCIYPNNGYKPRFHPNEVKRVGSVVMISRKGAERLLVRSQIKKNG